MSITSATAVLLLKTAPQATAEAPREHLKSETVASFNSGIVASILGCWPLSAKYKRLMNYLKRTNVYLNVKICFLEFGYGKILIITRVNNSNYRTNYINTLP
jgi:hypothetical protein